MKLLQYLMILMFAWQLTACGGKELIVLLPDEDGRAGQVSVGVKRNQVVLDSPYESAEIGVWGETKEGTISEEEVQSVFSGALSAQPEASKVFVLQYDLGSPIISSEYKPVLEALFAEVAARKAVEVQITGHTDRVGSTETNDRLSLERAERIKNFLLEQGLKARFIRAVGRGEREPAIFTEDNVPEPRNRRVEVIVR
jgi:outer membrane protein OmpA-like peptidoglycan-associated protein